MDNPVEDAVVLREHDDSRRERYTGPERRFRNAEYDGEDRRMPA